MSIQVEQTAIITEGFGNSNLTLQEWREMDSKKASEILLAMSLLERLEVLKNTPNYTSPFEFIFKKAKRELMEWYMNARATCSCLGHAKGARNESLVRKYGELMKKHGIPIPSDEVCFVLGIFNGNGAS
jgi:hypothetical protein